MIAHIERINTNTFIRVKQSYQSKGKILTGTLGGRKTIILGLKPKKGMKQVKVSVVNTDNESSYTRYKNKLLGLSDLPDEVKDDIFVLNSDTSGIFDVYKFVV